MKVEQLIMFDVMMLWIALHKLADVIFGATQKFHCINHQC